MTFASSAYTAVHLRVHASQSFGLFLTWDPLYLQFPKLPVSRVPGSPGSEQLLNSLAQAAAGQAVELVQAAEGGALVPREPYREASGALGSSSYIPPLKNPPLP